MVVVCWLALPGSGVERYTLLVRAAAQAAPPQITLEWDAQLTGYQISIYRRILGQAGGTWSNTPLAIVAHPQRTFSDTNVTPGIVYEYKVTRPYYDVMHDAVTLYICAGSDAPAVSERGKVLLVVDETMAAPLAYELDRLHLDLIADGWSVVRRTFARHGSATPAALRTFIQNVHTTEPGGITAVYLLGKLPRVQSGLAAPDGHALTPQDADVFYADIDGTWTDANGDGVYDQNCLPGNQRVELELGRTDLADLAAWPVGEQDLLRLYLSKSHVFRSGLLPVASTGIYASPYNNVEWAHVIALFGPDASVPATPAGTTGQAFPNAKTNAYLWGVDFYDWNGANYAYHRLKIQFAINFGSVKLYWRNGNNAMRAMLAQPTYGLTCAWGSRPNWYFHQMGMGRTIGYCAFRTQNNHASLNDYAPQCHYYFGGGVYVNLMGDPTLRMHVVPPPRDLHVAPADGTAIVHWAVSSDPLVHGYDVYRADELAGAYQRLTPAPLEATNYIDATVRTGTVYYMVKALKREAVHGGSYSNASIGVFNMLTLAGADNTPPAGCNAVTTTAEDTSVRILLAGIDPDGDRVGYGMVQQPLHGWLGGASNAWTYKPDANYNGTDSFVYMVYDRMSVAVGGTVDVRVTAVNDPPVASNQTVSNVMVNTGAIITLAGADVDANPLSYHIVSPPALGTVTGAPPRVVYWSPQVGTDTFTFAVSDGMVTSSTATVTIFVLCEPACGLSLIALAILRISNRPDGTRWRGRKR